MDTLRKLTIGWLLAAPLIGLIACLFESAISRPLLMRMLRLNVFATWLAVVGLVVTTIRVSNSPPELSLFTWLQLPDFTVMLGARVDCLACLQLLLTLTVLWSVLSAWPRPLAVRWLMVAWFGVTLTIVGSNLGQLFLGWTLSAWASSELARPMVTSSNGSPFRPVWLIQRTSDMLLLAAFGMVWLNFGGTLELSAWTKGAIERLRPELVESIAVCVLIGVIGRCAQLPLTVWLEPEPGFAARTGHSIARITDEMVGLWNVPDGHQVAQRLRSDPSNRWHTPEDESTPAPVLAWWMCAAFLPIGVGLLIRFEPFLRVAEHTRLLQVAVGAFTLLMCSASAATQTSWPRVLMQLAAGECGLLFVALGLNDEAGSELALFSLIWQSGWLMLLFLATTKMLRRCPRLIMVSSLCLASGIWGRGAMVDLVARVAWPASPIGQEETLAADQVLMGGSAAQVLSVVMVLVCVSEFLCGFSLLRACWLGFRERAESKEPRTPDDAYAPAWLWMVAGVIAVSGIWLGHDAELWQRVSRVVVPESSALNLSPITVGTQWPLAAAGAVLAWLMYSKPSTFPEKLATMFGPFARLSRQRFYWDDLYFLLFVQPLSAVAAACRWLDDQVLGDRLSIWPDRAVRSLGDAAEPITESELPIASLAAFSSVVLFVWLILWLQN
jgi:NADH:ubiquinone oxidoreductase subunit 5 (subunit L)/multisubunit Na+/H+ antiporter MnhA subunit